MNVVLGGTITKQLYSGVARVWGLVSCPRCAGVITIEASTEGKADEVLRVVPESAMQQFNVNHLPDDVARFYQSAIRVLQVGEPDACAVQLRRTLEAATAHKGIANGVLSQRIEKLIENGLVTNEFGKVLDYIREVGNIGAHATDEPVGDESVARALMFTTQLLRNLFEIPKELGRIEIDKVQDEAIKLVQERQRSS